MISATRIQTVQRQERGRARRSLQDRYQALQDRPVDFIGSPLFEEEAGEDAVESLRPTEEKRGTGATGRRPKGLPSFLAMLYATPLLTPDEEKYLFCRMNFLKCRAARVLDSIRPKRPSQRKLQAVEQDLDEADQIRNRIVQSNLRLVVAIAKKFVSPTQPLDELFADGYVPLIRAVELFDYARGNRFSTYATWAVRNHLLRQRSTAARRSQLFAAGDCDTVNEAIDERTHESESLRAWDQNVALLKSLMELVPEREKNILAARFGLGHFEREHTLKEIGQMFGLSKERVRQLAIRSMATMQEAATEGPAVELSL